jgi:hypothetical protein
VPTHQGTPAIRRRKTCAQSAAGSQFCHLATGNGIRTLADPGVSQHADASIEYVVNFCASTNRPTSALFVSIGQRLRRSRPESVPMLQPITCDVVDDDEVAIDGHHLHSIA